MASCSATRIRTRVEKPEVRCCRSAGTEQVLQADADQQLPALDQRARRRAGAGDRRRGPARQQHRRADRRAARRTTGSRTGHRRAHQNEMRLSALAIEIVKIPTYVSRRMPRSPVRSIGSDVEARFARREEVARAGHAEQTDGAKASPP